MAIVDQLKNLFGKKPVPETTGGLSLQEAPSEQVSSDGLLGSNTQESVDFRLPQETDRVWGMRQGARDYVTKPVNPADLLAKIQALG